MKPPRRLPPPLQFLLCVSARLVPKVTFRISWDVCMYVASWQPSVRSSRFSDEVARVKQCCGRARSIWARSIWVRLWLSAEHCLWNQESHFKTGETYGPVDLIIEGKGCFRGCSLSLSLSDSLSLSLMPLMSKGCQLY